MGITSLASPSNSLSVVIPVEPANWQNAYNSKADAKDSLVIFFTSPNGIKHGRQYDPDPQAEGLYNCIGCLSQRRIKSNAQFKSSKLFMASFHDCATISYDTIQSQQAEREAKFKKRQRPSSAASSSRVNQEGTSRKKTGETSNSSSKRPTPITPTPLKDMNGDVGDSSKRQTPSTRAPSRAKNEDTPPRNTESDSPIAITPEQRTHLVHIIGDTPERISLPSSGHPQKITSYFKAAGSSTSCSRTQPSVGGNGRTSKEPPHSLSSKNKATETGNNESSSKESPTDNAQHCPDFDDIPLTGHVPSNYSPPESTPFAMNQSSKNQDEILIDDDSKDIVTAKKTEKEPKNVPTVTTHIDADITIVKSVVNKPDTPKNENRILESKIQKESSASSSSSITNDVSSNLRQIALSDGQYSFDDADVNRDKAQKRRKSAANEEENSDSGDEKPAKRTRRNAAQDFARKNQSLFNDSESDDHNQSMDDSNTSDATASNNFVQQDAHDIPSSINDTNPIRRDELAIETLSQQPTPPSDSGENHPAAQLVHHSDFHVPLEANLPFSHHFIHPSSAFPERCCKKLNLEYSFETYAFWSKIHISEFSHISIPSTTLPLAHAKNSGFAAVSLYLTGSENFAMDIKDVVIPYLFKNASAIGQCLGMNLTHVNDPVVLDILQSFTNVHFVVMAQMLECRFAVYENGKWMRYGSWTDGLPLYILELKDGQYSPVLSFKK